MREKRGTEIDRVKHRDDERGTQTNTQTNAYTHKERGSDSVVTSRSDKSTKEMTVVMIISIQIKILLNI